MRSIVRALIVLIAVCAARPALAEQPKCPMDVKSCLAAFEEMRHRPFVGILYDRDSTGTLTVIQVVTGSPAEKAGMKIGDVLINLNGVPISDAPKLIVGKAGWKTGTKVRYGIRRGEQDHQLGLTLGEMSNEQLARMIGEHMVEAHLAYGESGTEQGH